jgi:hypothetical protein
VPAAHLRACVLQIIVTLVLSQLLVNSAFSRAALSLIHACALRVRPAFFAADPAPAALLVWMFYAKGVNCCAELKRLLDSGPDGGACPPVGLCRGFAGDCAALPGLFARISVLPDYPNGLGDTFACHAFPDDDEPLDSFIVRRRRSVRLPRHGLRLTRAAHAAGWPHLHRQCVPCRASSCRPAHRALTLPLLAALQSRCR